MRAILSYFKPFDYIIILLAILISFIPTIITHVRFANLSDQEVIALVKIDGIVVDEYSLSENTPPFEKTYYPNDGQYNIIEIDGPRIRIKEDNSPDQVGVNTGWIERPGQTAICLPHGFLIEVTGTQEADPLILPL